MGLGDGVRIGGRCRELRGGRGSRPGGRRRLGTGGFLSKAGR